MTEPSRPGERAGGTRAVGPRPVDVDLVPETTGDERGEGWGEAAGDDAGYDERILRERPPHHGG